MSEAFMDCAVEEARKGITAKHGGPFGCSIVRNGKIIASAHNTVLKCQDSTNHAEMNCIREASKVLETHDLSDCELYTTCEPCPMCWGACNWARVKHIYIGVDRKTAAEFGFDDEFFYKELETSAMNRSLKCQDGMESQEINEFLRTTATYRHRLLVGGGVLAKVQDSLFSMHNESGGGGSSPHVDNAYMKEALNLAKEGAAEGANKEREPFGALIVKDDVVIAKGFNTVLRDRDPTATAEINAIRQACKSLGSFNLEGCEIYCTVEPDLMSLGALYWSRISSLYIGVQQSQVAKFGFQESFMQYKELRLAPAERIIPCSTVLFDECHKVFVQWKASQGELY